MRSEDDGLREFQEEFLVETVFDVLDVALEQTGIDIHHLLDHLARIVHVLLYGLQFFNVFFFHDLLCLYVSAKVQKIFETNY